MISQLQKSGADYCKFQTWKVKNLKDGPWNNDGRLEIYNKAELYDQNHSPWLNLCKKYNVNFLTSIFNINDIDFFSNYQMKLLKYQVMKYYN